MPTAPVSQVTPSNPEPTVSVAQAAFHRCHGRLAALPATAVVSSRIDAQVAAVFALGISRFVEQAAVRARFAALAAAGELELAEVEQLADLAHCVWFARHHYLLANATRSRALLPAALAAASTALRGRMLRVVSYHLGSEPEAARRIEAIRGAAGYLGLANGLQGLGELYVKHQARLAGDVAYYIEGDAAAATGSAFEIVEQLGRAPSEADGWHDLQRRGFTLLSRSYDEVRRGGRFLFARDNGERRFPSMVDACRKRPGRAGAGVKTAD